jgi:hypothetical protein
LAQLIVSSGQLGKVAVTEELLDAVGPDGIQAAIRQLRFNGGTCLICDAPIHAVEDVSLATSDTPVGTRLTFLHLRCGPPQRLDLSRNRRAAIAMDRDLHSRSMDLQAFTVLREYPAPLCMLVISPEIGITTHADNGDQVTWWTFVSSELGLVPVGPNVLDATPPALEGWVLHVTGRTLVVESPSGSFFEGNPELPQEWLEALAVERRCVLLSAGLGVNSSELQPRTGRALDHLASQGLLAGATVRVDGILGLNTALGFEAALVAAKTKEAILSAPRDHKHAGSCR